MGGSGRISKASLGVVLFVGFLWCLFVGILANQTTKTTSIPIPSTPNFKLLKMIGTQRLVVHQGLDLNYVSKRRVPNGPDPIHNRYSSLLYILVYCDFFVSSSLSLFE
ncbi:unnamed protein product [Ilex paraguariensis]|uniref:CLAVATA3/ESR (CLE)-related protein 25 n=1 Tax=Ilex paraguariensis TaxID=185542 RepID=A0ABC8TKM6_9AQUA